MRSRRSRAAIRTAFREPAEKRRPPQGANYPYVGIRVGIDQLRSGRCHARIKPPPFERRVKICLADRLVALSNFLAQLPSEFPYAVEVRHPAFFASGDDERQFDELLAREHFIVAVAPAQAREVVAQGFGQIAVFLVLHDIHRAMALGQFLAVGPENQDVARFREGSHDGIEIAVVVAGVAHGNRTHTIGDGEAHFETIAFHEGAVFDEAADAHRSLGRRWARRRRQSEPLPRNRR